MSRDDRTVVFQLPTVISGHLACIAGTVAGRSWDLSAGTFVIGRLPSSDLALPQEPGVSKVHAKIIAEGDRYTLVDAESRNGTIVNGQPVQRVALKDGDEIRICGCVLRFTQTGGAGGIRNPASQLDQPPLQAPPPTPAPAPPPSAPQAAAQRPPTSPGFQAGPTEAFPAVGADLPPDTVVAPRAEVKSGMGLLGWFATGLLLSIVLGGGAFGALRIFGDDLLGPADESGATGGDLAATGAPKATDDKRGDDKPADDKPGDARAVADGGQLALAIGGTGGADAAAAKADGGQGATGGDEGAGSDTQATAPAGGDGADTRPEPEPETEPEPVEVWLPVEVSEPGPVVIRARGGGRIRSVDVEDGARVEKGQALAELDEQANAAEIATLKESIRALESVAESQESAKQYLEQEKAKLQRLLAQQRASRITAPTSGTLVGFTLKAGERVRARQVVGMVRPDRGAVVPATVPRAQGQKLKRGAPAKLRTTSGEVVDGRVAAVRKRGDSYTVTLDVGGASPRDVEEVRF